MRYEERDDGELIELAQAGWAPAFGVLVHRHAPGLLAAFADTPDPSERVTDLFLRAMRQLPERDPADPVGPWLSELAGRPVPDAVPPVGDETLDPIWRELASRWPDGRRVRRRRPVARRLLTVVGALALGVAVPIVVLGMPASSDDDGTEAVRAQPIEEEPASDDEPVELPTFEFPDVGSGGTGGPDGAASGTGDPPPSSDDGVAEAPTSGGTDEPTTPAPGTGGGTQDDTQSGTDDGTGAGGTGGGGATDGTTDDRGSTDGTSGTTDGTADGGVTDGTGSGTTDGTSDGTGDGGTTDGTGGGTSDGGTTDGTGGATDGTGGTGGTTDAGDGTLVSGLGGRP